MYLQNEKGYMKRIAISEENLKRLRIDSKKLYLKYHPEAKHRNITDNEMEGIILDFYLSNETQ